MANFSNHPKRGYKKVKYSKGDGTSGYFYSDPKNSPKDVEHYKKGQVQVAISTSVEDKIPGEARTGAGSKAGKILAPRSHDPDWKVTDIIKQLAYRRKKKRLANM